MMRRSRKVRLCFSVAAFCIAVYIYIKMYQFTPNRVDIEGREEDFTRASREFDIEVNKTIPGYNKYNAYKAVQARTTADNGRPDGIPIILYWTTFFGGDYGYLDGTKYSQAHCGPMNLCEVTTDKSRFQESAAILIHANDHFTPLPATRKPWQRVVYYNHENHDQSSAKTYRHNVINWTMTYRRDSDIFMPYGFTIPINRHSGVDVNYALGKTHLAIVIMSNCNAPSRRMQYIKELQKHAQVDIYGGCSDKRCGKRGTNSCSETANKYKFYLSFENTICLDYVTEKVFDRLIAGLVPIVLGGAPYDEVLPKNSYIDIGDFKTPRELAGYLKQIDGNDDLYNQFFDWKKHYQLSESRAPAFCELCSKLRSTTEPYQVYTDINKWYTEETCIPPEKKYPHLAPYFG